MDKLTGFDYNENRVEIRRAYRIRERLVRYWAQQAVALCKDIEDESLEEYAAPVRQAAEALTLDRRIMVMGGPGCGKSSILAGLAEVPVIAGHTMEGAYLCWRYVCHDGESRNSRFLPLPELDGLELVDTASCAGEGAEVCRTLMKGADVVVAVVDGRSPAEAPVWDLLAEMPAPQLADCLLAVTHTDLIDAESQLSLRDTLRALCAEKLHRELPLYLVTPTNRNSMESFRSRVQDVVRGAQSLRGAIRRLADRATDLVDKQSRVLRARHSVSVTDMSFLSGIDQEIDNFLTRQLNSLGDHLAVLKKAMEQALPPLLRRVREAFGYALSPTTLLRLELMGADTDRSLYHEIETQVQRIQNEADQQFVLSCSSHWRSVRPRMKKTLECEIGDFPATALESELGKLRMGLCRDMYEPFASTGLRHRLYGVYTAQAGWMHAYIIFLCFLLVVGGVLGYMGQDVPGLSCVVMSLVLWLLGCLGHNLAYRHVALRVKAMAEELCADMETALRNSLEHLLISRMTAYRNLYTQPREKVARQSSTLAPLQERQKDIRMHLRSIMPRL